MRSKPYIRRTVCIHLLLQQQIQSKYRLRLSTSDGSSLIYLPSAQTHASLPNPLRSCTHRLKFQKPINFVFPIGRLQRVSAYPPFHKPRQDDQRGTETEHDKAIPCHQQTEQEDRSQYALFLLRISFFSWHHLPHVRTPACSALHPSRHI